MSRSGDLSRETLETTVRVKLGLDGEGIARVETGVGFLDHMLVLLSHHSGIDLEVQASGDLVTDDHHVVEDIAIVLGRTLLQALGEKRGIGRYGSMLMPMDEVLVGVAVDLSGRPCFVSDYKPQREKVGDLSTEMVSHFFRTLAVEARCALHFSLLHVGRNEHHRIEAMFKGLGRALAQAVEIQGVRATVVPSSKGVLEGAE